MQLDNKRKYVKTMKEIEEEDELVTSSDSEEDKSEDSFSSSFSCSRIKESSEEVEKKE